MEKKIRRSFGNIGLLDLRQATEETFAKQNITAGNVGMALVSPSTRHLLGNITLGNIGNVVEIPENAKLVQGDFVIEPGTLTGMPLDLVIVGNMRVQPEVTADALRSGIKSIVLVGTAVWPVTLDGVLREKITTCTGIVLAHRGNPRVVQGRCTLTETLLDQYEDGTELLVIGKLLVPHPLSSVQIAKKIGRLTIAGKAVWPEENDADFRKVLDDDAKIGKIDVVPRGFKRVEELLILDADSIERYTGAKLDCRYGLVISDDVTPEAFAQAITALCTNDFVLYPAALKAAVRERCVSSEQPKLITYSGELEVVEDDGTLMESRFRFARKKLVVVATGDLKIDPALAAETIFDRVEKAVLLGDTSCTQDQAGALRARLALNQGDLQVPAAEREGEKNLGDTDGGSVGNIGYLVL